MYLYVNKIMCISMGVNKEKRKTYKNSVCLVGLVHFGSFIIEVLGDLLVFIILCIKIEVI